MPDLSSRSYEKELLDRADIPFSDIKRNLEELEIINTRLGGHRITLYGLREILKQRTGDFSVCEIGCGGGDNLKAIYKRYAGIQGTIRLTGIDINKECIEYARENCKQLPAAEFIVSDYRPVSFADQKPDIVFSSLFCHHLNDEEFIEMLQWCKANSACGFFINDLHRHVIAYYSIKLLSYFFSKSYLVKNDAPLSVKRGFRKKEFESLLRQAGITHYTIRWKWAFRWLIVIKH